MIKNEETCKCKQKFETTEEEIAALEARLAEVKERQAQEREAEKEAAKLTRKEDAEIVKAAISVRLETEAEARKAKIEAYKIYQEALDGIEKAVAEKREAERKALAEFCEKHPEGFHETVKAGDALLKVDYSTANSVNFVDPFRKLFELF